MRSSAQRVGLVLAALVSWCVGANAGPTVVISNPDALMTPYSFVIWAKARAMPEYPVDTMTQPSLPLGDEKLKCEVGMQVQIRGNTTLYRTSEWKLCAPTVPFEVQRRNISSNPQYAPILPVIMKASETEALKPFATAVVVAIDRGDIGTAAFASNELLDQANRAGIDLDVRPLEAFTKSSTAAALAAKLGRKGAEATWVAVDPHTGAVEFTPKGVQTLTGYQAAAKIGRTGQADWATLQSLSGRSWADLATGLGDQ